MYVLIGFIRVQTQDLTNIFHTKHNWQFLLHRQSCQEGDGGLSPGSCMYGQINGQGKKEDHTKSISSSKPSGRTDQIQDLSVQTYQALFEMLPDYPLRHMRQIRKSPPERLFWILVNSENVGELSEIISGDSG